MTKFQKALRSQNKASRHAFVNVGFRKSDDPGLAYSAVRHMEGKSNFVKKNSSKKMRFPKGGLV